MAADPTAQGWCTDTALSMTRCGTESCRWYMFGHDDYGRRLCLGCRAALKKATRS